MNKELYDKLFNRMDELSAIRKDLSFGCPIEYIGTYIRYRETLKIFFETKYCERNKRNFHYLGTHGKHWEVGMDDGEMEQNIKIIGHLPILSDCLKAVYEIHFILNANGGEVPIHYILNFIEMWNFNKPFLYDQEDVVGDELLALLS